jgi:hypothetical protein
VDYIINHDDAIPNDIMCPSEFKYANRSKTQLSIWYIQSIVELKYANMLYTFHDFTVQKL